MSEDTTAMTGPDVAANQAPDPDPLTLQPSKVKVRLTLVGYVDVPLRRDDAGYTATGDEARMEEQVQMWNDDPVSLFDTLTEHPDREFAVDGCQIEVLEVTHPTSASDAVAE